MPSRRDVAYALVVISKVKGEIVTFQASRLPLNISLIELESNIVGAWLSNSV